MPQPLSDAVQFAAHSQEIGAPALIRQSVANYLERVMIPNILASVEGLSPIKRIAKLRLVATLRRGIESDWPPGRARAARNRGFYAAYCAARARIGAPRLPFAKWLASIDEITLTPAGNLTRE